MRAWRMVAATVLIFAMAPATTAWAGDRSLNTAPPGGLAVYTSPDPSPVASTAYIYSPVALSAAPSVRVTGPAGQVAVLRSVFEKDHWWTAPLPGGAPGIRQVSAAATTADGTRVGGASSYEIVRPVAGGQPGWHSAGPGAVGGLFAADQADPRRLYVASPIAAELYASADAGRSWRLERTLPVGGGYPTALLTLGHRLLLAVNGGNGFYVDDPTYTGKVLASDDGGRHWRDLGMPDSFVVDLVASPDGARIVAVTKSGLQISSDAGRRWRHVDATWGDATIDGATIVGGDLYVATFTGLYVLRDVATATTAPVLAFTPPGGRSAWVVAVAGDAGTLYADAWSGGVFASHDHGTTWTHVYDPPGSVLMFQDIAGTLYTFASMTLTVASDGGAVWRTEPVPVPGGYYNGVAVVGRRIYLSTVDAGIYASDDHGASYHAVGGVPGLDVYGLAVASGHIIAGTPSDTYATSVRNATRAVPQSWQPLRPQTVSGTAIPDVGSTPDGSVAYKVRSGPRIGTYTPYVSRDGGATWKSLGTFYGNVGALLVDPADPDDIYVTASSSSAGNTMVISRDGGATWTSVALPDKGLALAGDPTEAHRIWLGGPGGLWSSTDGGATFTRVDATAVSALTVLRDHRVIAAGAQVRYTDDGGATMHVARQPGLDVSFSAVVGSPRDPATVFAATTAFHDAGLLKGGHGVLVSTDAGRSWTPLNSRLDDRDVTSLALTPDGDWLFAGTLRGGVFAIPLPRSAR